MLYVVFFCQLKTLKLQQFYQHLNTARFEYKLRNSGKVNDIKQMYNGMYIKLGNIAFSFIKD